MRIKLSLLFLLTWAFALAQPNRLDSKGRKQGLWSKPFPGSTQVRYRGEFQDDVPVKTFTYFYENGRKRAEHIYRGKTGVCYAKEYNEEGQLLAEGLFKKEKRDSIWTFYTGDKILLQREGYQNGIKHGESILYYENGKVAERKTYVNDQLQGPWTQAYDDGTPKAKGNYKNDLLDGEVLYYGLTGKLAAKGMMVNGLKEGVWYFFDLDGKLERKATYHQGREKLPPGAKPAQAEEDNKEDE